jgi:hypothetical protein
MKVRSSVTALLAAWLLAGATSAAAQSPDAMGAATFTASNELLGEYVENVTGSADGVTQVRADFQGTWTASDLRASGTASYGVDRFDHSGATVHAGTFRLENEGGSWEGTFTGYWDAAGRHYDITAAGQGGYTGWTMLVEDLCECSMPTSVASGVIVPGGLPGGEG